MPWFYGREDFLLYLAGIAIVLIVNHRLQSTYAHYKNVDTSSGLRGVDVARKILDSNGLTDVPIEKQSNGTLSDFYDPRKNLVSLSPDTYDGTSIASISVAAHEVGHALQHATGYNAINTRNKILPYANIASRLSWVVITLGLLLTRATNLLLYIGIGMLLVVLLFQVVTLPIEFNASSRAIKQLDDLQIVEPQEKVGCQKMLKAAALTYVAGVVNSLVQVLRVILVSNNRKRDN